MNMDLFEQELKRIKSTLTSKREFRFEKSNSIDLFVGYHNVQSTYIHYRYNISDNNHNFLVLTMDNGLARVMICGSRIGGNILSRNYFIQEDKIEAYLETRKDKNPVNWESISSLELMVDIRDSFSNLPMFKVEMKEKRVVVQELIEV
jgi:hypothetical protein